MKWNLWFFSLLFGLSSASAETRLTQGELLDIIRSAESAIVNLDLAVDLREYVRMEGGEAKETGYRVKCNGLLAPKPESMFKIHYSGTVYTHFEDSGPKDLVSQEHQGSYNGNTAMEIFYGSAEGGKSAMHKAHISRAPNRNGVMVDNCGLDGTLFSFQQLGGIDPEVSRPYGLAYYLENIPPEWGTWSIIESNKDNCVRIKVPYSKSDVCDILEIDLSRGANIVEATLWKDFGKPEAKTIVILDNIVLRQVDSLWLPIEARRSLGSTMTQVSVVYNAVNKPLTPEDFVLDIPEGLAVLDGIVGDTYIKGKPQEKVLADLEMLDIEEDEPQERPDANAGSSEGISNDVRESRDAPGPHNENAGNSTPKRTLLVGICVILAFSAVLVFRGTSRGWR